MASWPRSVMYGLKRSDLSMSSRLCATELSSSTMSMRILSTRLKGKRLFRLDVKEALTCDPEWRVTRLVKALTDKHLAIFRQHMVDVIGIHAELSSDEIGKSELHERVLAAMREVPRHL